MPLTIIRQDITRLDTDAIVNAANTKLQQGGGVCGAIFKAAGAEPLQAACDLLAPIATGEAVVTPGFGLDAKYIIHAAGPAYEQHTPEDSRRLLRQSYHSALKRAVEQGCQSVAFPLISSGIYGYPKQEALQVAREAIGDFLAKQPADEEMDVFLAVFDKEAFSVSQSLQAEVASYIDQHYVDERMEYERSRRRGELESEMFSVRSRKPELLERSVQPYSSLEEQLQQLDLSFSQAVLKLIDQKDMKDPEVYKRANISRQVFSKLRTDDGYQPMKRTALALAVGLRLTLPETRQLLQHAGYTLSHSSKMDVIVEYFLIKGIHDIHQINAMLSEHEQGLLG